MRSMAAVLVALALAGCDPVPNSRDEPAPPSAAVTNAMAAARAHVAANEEAIVRELRDLLALPNVASNADDIRRNAEALVAMFERRGIAARILETPEAPL